jgi:hypothetical protein
MIQCLITIAPDSLRLELDAGRYARAEGSKRIKPLHSSKSTWGVVEQLPEFTIHRAEMTTPPQRAIGNCQDQIPNIQKRRRTQADQNST